MRYFLFSLLCVCFMWNSYLEGKSFSSGHSKSSSSSSSRSFSSGSSRGFSSGSSSKSYSSGSSSKSYSSGSSSKSYSSGDTSKNSPSTTKTFDSKASNAAKVNESKSFFQKSSSVQYTRPPVSAPEIQEVKKQTFYKNYYTDPRYREVHHYHYNDSYSPLFMLWMLDRSLDERAMWMYNHRDSMDNARYKEMLAKDAALEKKIAELENKGVKKDPNYQPQGVDNDLIYKSDKELSEKEDSNAGAIALILLSILGFGEVVWFIFFRKAY